jgi:protein-disulfide isomerase
MTRMMRAIQMTTSDKWSVTPPAAILSLLLAVALTITAGGVSSAQETAEPELTWAPLVTLPPIAAPPIATPLELADGFRLGAADAPVAIEVWEDFQCPFCQRFTFQVEPALVAEYILTGRASLTFRQLPFLGDESHWAAVAASLAAEQDRFWPFHDYLFANLLGENVGSYELERLLAMGEAAGLDMARFKEGLTLERARQRFAEIEAEARQDASALGISATPTVTVNGVPLQSPDFETVAAAIEAALASEGASLPGESPAQPGSEAPGTAAPETTAPTATSEASAQDD